MKPNTSVFDLDLDAKAFRGVMALGAKTVGDLLSVDPDSVCDFHGIGIGTVQRLYALRERIEMSLANDSTPVDCRGNMPDESFILHEIVQGNMLATVKEQLGGRAGVLDTLGITSFRQLLALDRNELISVKSVGPKFWTRLQAVISNTISRAAASCSMKLRMIRPDYFPLFSGIALSGNPAPFIPDSNLPIFNVVFDKRIVSVLKRLKLTTLQDAMLTPYNRLLSRKNFGIDSLNKLRKGILDYLDDRDTLGKLVDPGSSFSGFLRNLCKASGQHFPATKIFARRFCGKSGSVETYKTIGRDRGCSREGIRLILNDVIGRVNVHYRSRDMLAHFHDTARRFVEDSRGILSLKDLGIALSCHFSWSRAVSEKSLYKFLKSFPPGGDVEVHNYIMTIDHPCRKCNKLVESLRKMFDTHQSVVSPFTDIIQFASCKLSDCTTCAHASDMHYSRLFLYELANRAGLNYDEDNIYSVNAWRLITGSMIGKARAALETLGRAATNQEIRAIVNPYLDNLDYTVTQNNLHQSLVCDRDVFRWGKGSYILRKHINISEKLVAKISRFLSVKLKDCPVVSLYGVFRELREPCLKAGIPDDFALRAVVMMYTKDFYVDQHRFVYGKPFGKNDSVHKYAAQWVRKQKGIIRISDLARWVEETVGARQTITKYVFESLPMRCRTKLI